MLVLSQYYDPEPIVKPADLARGLHALGHDVDVVTGLPNYPSGRLAPGFRLRLLQRETRDGIEIRRAFEFPYHGRSVGLRLLNYWSFALSAPIAALFCKRPDVIYVWHPPTTTGVAAWVISILRRVPFVYDIHDVWSESAVVTGFIERGILFRMVQRLERFVYRRATHCIIHTEGIREHLQANGIAAGRMSLLPDWVDDTFFEKSARREEVRRARQWQDRFVVVFAGNFGGLQRLDLVVEAAARLDPASPVLVVLIGDGVERERVETLVRERGLASRVQLIERRPLQEMPHFLAAADALLVHLAASDLARSVVPSKTLSYLAAARPVVMAMEGAAAELIAESHAGIVVKPGDPDALARALESLAAMPEAELNAMGERGRDHVERHFARASVLPRYEALLARVAGRS